MDWIGDKLAQLIEEGKRALGKEIVVMSDAQEDEVDDGSGNWIEENDYTSRVSTSYASPYSLSSVASPPSPMMPTTPSPHTAFASFNSIGKPSRPVAITRQSQPALRVRNSYTPKARHGKSRSEVGDMLRLGAYEVDGGLGLPMSVPTTPNMVSRFDVSTPGTSVQESEQEWQSAHIQESMERARAAYRQKRGLGLEGL